jgi:DNA-3-methyladenine glycosylase II
VAADLTLERYRLWGEDPANVYRQGVLCRVLRLGSRRVPFRLEARGGVDRPRAIVRFEGPDDAATRAALRREAAALLGLDWDLDAFYRHAAGDPVLAPWLRPLRGLRPTLMRDPFEMLVGAISAQQVNLAFAFTTRARLVRRYGEPFVAGGIPVYAFPTPAAVAEADPAALRAMQFSTRKAEYIIGLARALAEGRLDGAALPTLRDTEVIARLTAVRGLGVWTAEWFLARSLGRPDVCPAGDLGVRRAVEGLCFRGRPSTPDRVRRRALAWRPYRTLAVHYLLAALRLVRAASPRPRARRTAGGGTS